MARGRGRGRYRRTDVSFFLRAGITLEENRMKKGIGVKSHLKAGSSGKASG